MGLGIQIASLFASIGVNTDPLNKGLGGAKQSLQAFGGEMAKQVIGTVTLAGAVYKAGQTIVDSIRDWVDYADAMRLSAQMAGVTTEEMSRLVQAADDFRVPMETMQRSMEMALKNGFVPTIENLAELSDRLIAIDDPALRAAEASKLFGKSYADILPFLMAGGDAIRDVTDGIADNLVVTEEAAQQAKEYKDALDALGDAWTGLKNKIGQFAVPALTDVINNLAGQPTELMKMQDAVIAAAKKAFDDSKISAEEYQAVLDNVSTSTGTYTEYVSKLNFILGILNKTNEETTSANVAATINGVDLSAARDEYLATAGVLKEDLAGAYDAVRDAEQNWRGGVAGQIKSGLDQALADGKINAEEYIGALETLDSYAGTQFAYEFKIEESIPDLVKSLIEDPTGFMSDMATFENAMMPLDTAVSNAMALVSDLQQQLIDLERTYYATVQIAIGGGTGIGGGSSGSIPWYLRASGGPVSDGAPYIVGEQGPELFVPGASGQIVSNDMLGGGNSEMLGDILMELQSQPSRIKVAVREAMALVGG